MIYKGLMTPAGKPQGTLERGRRGGRGRGEGGDEAGRYNLLHRVLLEIVFIHFQLDGECGAFAFF